jgi:hypothetical protein
MDWHLVNRQQWMSSQRGWNQADWTRACFQRGGAALLAGLIGAVAESLQQDDAGEYSILQTAAPQSRVHPDDARFHHAYALWSLFEDGEKLVWRVEEYLGLDRPPGSSAAADWKRVVGDRADADIVLLDDANLGFRDHPQLWPAAIDADARPSWILVKMARPVAKGALWAHLQEHHADRLIVVMPVNDLRRTEVHISRGLSWERTAQDIAWELVHNPCVNTLSRCAHVVISFHTAGAMLLSQPGADEELSAADCSLFFDPHVIEGMWQQSHPGQMIGYTTCLTAGIGRQLILAPDEPDVQQGIQSGLSAMRRLHIDGYVMDAPEGGRLSFPTRRIAEELAENTTTFAAVEVQDPVRFLSQSGDRDAEQAPDRWWTILEDRYRENLDWIAEQVVLEGAETALQDVPQGRFGHLLTVDRREIESFRSVHTLAAEYLQKEKPKRPLSIAVFGAPGSGKSFGITQVAESLAPGRIKVLEFNLSQLGGPQELVDALHRVRDVTLAGRIPLVFWDEFDSSLDGKSLGWLCYFLAPMQDGAFREGQIVHPIGRSIFVFAGGTSHRMEDFGGDLSAEAYRAAKVPDFVSRLRGYVDVLGPNPPDRTDDPQDAFDPYYVIRRAILLRSILQRSVPQVFEEKEGRRVLEIDPGVLRAFLGVSRYKHGIRSMESIVAMSQLSGKRGFERSSLPAEDQLDLHVDGREFLALVQQIDLGPDLLERLAKAAHEVFCAGLRARGYAYGPHTDEEQGISSALIPYKDLDDELKEQNRAYVRDIPNKVARVGYAMVPARSDQAPFDFPGEDLERLARMEHRRWMGEKLHAGWEYGRKTDEAQRLSEALLPWEKLPEAQKEKDRDLVRGIPRILAKAGYTVVKLHRGDEEQ